MTTDRSYRTSLSPIGAVQELGACTGTHFDAEVVGAFRAEFPDPDSFLLG